MSKTTPVLSWSNAKTLPVADIRRIAAEIARAAGDRNAPPWCGKLPAPWEDKEPP